MGIFDSDCEREAAELGNELLAIEAALNAANVPTVTGHQFTHPDTVRPLTLMERLRALISERDEARKLAADVAHQLANERQLVADLRERALSEEFIAFLDNPQTIEAIADAKASVALSPARAMTGVEQTRAIGVLRDLVAHLLIRKDDTKQRALDAEDGQ